MDTSGAWRTCEPLGNTVGPGLGALLRLAREYTASVGNTSDEAWQAAIDAGWSDTQLTELATHVTLNLLTNYFNHHVHTDLDGKPAPAL